MLSFVFNIANSRGDPHITTLDGKVYTFNGLGEYTMLNFDEGSVLMQARTDKAIDKDGKEVKATIFSAFAMKGFETVTVFVGLNASRTGLT